MVAKTFSVFEAFEGRWSYCRRGWSNNEDHIGGQVEDLTGQAMGRRGRALSSGRTIRFHFGKIRVEEGRAGPSAIIESGGAEGFSSGSDSVDGKEGWI